MKKLSYVFIVCLIVFSVFAFSVRAEGGISRAVYSNSEIYFAGQLIEWNTLPVLVVEEDENSAKTYVPIREFFERLGYDVFWQENRSIHIEGPEPGEIKAPDSSDGQLSTMFLAEAGGANFYQISGEKREARYTMLTYGDVMKIYNWSAISPRMQYPEMYMKDVDGDGEDEIVIISWPAAGTGIFYNELFVVEIIRENGVACDLVATELDTYLDYIDGVVDLKAETDGGKTFLYITCEAQSLTVPLDGLSLSSDIQQMNMRGGVWRCDITMTDTGFHIRMPLAVQAGQSAIPELVAYFDADFEYTAGGFEFSNPIIAAE